MNTPSRALSLMLGPSIETTVGLECNLYFEGLLPYFPTEQWELTITCELGRQLTDRWNLVPEADQIGRHPFTLRYRDPASGEVVSTSSEICVRAPGETRRHLRWLPIGDSITHALGYLKSTVARAPGFNLDLSAVGSRISGDIRHEGYPGWKVGHFFGEYHDRDANFREQIASPFLFDGTTEMDIPAYLRRHLDGKEPDLITVFLGTNDIGLLNDENRAAGIEISMAHARILIDSLLAATSASRIGLIGPLNPAGQDAFGINYGCLLNRSHYRKSQRAFVQALRERFMHHHSRISFIPAHAQIDSFTGYPSAIEPRNAHTEETHRVNTNAVHPSPCGHQQISNAILSWMIAKSGEITPFSG
jgi:lysophospholipase L1-like esterase